MFKIFCNCFSEKNKFTGKIKMLLSVFGNTSKEVRMPMVTFCQKSQVPVWSCKFYSDKFLRIDFIREK